MAPAVSVKGGKHLEVLGGSPNEHTVHTMGGGEKGQGVGERVLASSSIRRVLSPPSTLSPFLRPSALGRESEREADSDAGVTLMEEGK